jgi:hypothetical protein
VAAFGQPGRTARREQQFSTAAVARNPIWKRSQNGLKKGVVAGAFAVAARHQTPELIVHPPGLRQPIRLDQRQKFAGPALARAEHSGNGTTFFRNAARCGFEHEFGKPRRQR